MQTSTESARAHRWRRAQFWDSKMQTVSTTTVNKVGSAVRRGNNRLSLLAAFSRLDRRGLPISRESLHSTRADDSRQLSPLIAAVCFPHLRRNLQTRRPVCIGVVSVCFVSYCCRSVYVCAGLSNGSCKKRAWSLLEVTVAARRDSYRYFSFDSISFIIPHLILSSHFITLLQNVVVRWFRQPAEKIQARLLGRTKWWVVILVNYL